MRAATGWVPVGVRRIAGVLAAVLAAGTVALCAGCGVPPGVPGPGPTSSPPATIPAGAPTPSLPPGPGSHPVYTVQAQPAPGSCHYRWASGDPLPDPACTPGAVDPEVTQASIATTICRVGWTATVRPPVGVTGPEKAASALAYGYTGPFTTAEYDHLVPLELGGDPNDPANLWVEPNDRPGATSTFNAKDALEATLHDLVCTGRLSLATARQAIASDWVATSRRYGA